MNLTIFNSEIWNAYNENDLKLLYVLDRKILQLILGAQNKVPSEMLHLKTGAPEPKFVIAVRRIINLKSIHKNMIINDKFRLHKRNLHV